MRRPTRALLPATMAAAAAVTVVATAAACGESGAPGSATSATSATTRGSSPPATAPGSTRPPSSVAPPPPDGVAIADFTFTPGVLEVDAGATVTFRNDDDFEHRVQRLDTGAASPDLAQGDTWTFVADGPAGGEIPYYCAIHNVMRAAVRIRGAA